MTMCHVQDTPHYNGLDLGGRTLALGGGESIIEHAKRQPRARAAAVALKTWPY